MNVSVIALTSAIGPFKPHGGVDRVGQQIASDAAASNCHIQTPQSFAALRQIPRHRPIL